MIERFDKKDFAQIIKSLEEIGIFIISPKEFLSKAEILEVKDDEIKIKIERWAINGFIPEDTTLAALKNEVEKISPAEMTIKFNKHSISCGTKFLKSTIFFSLKKMKEVKEIMGNQNPFLIGYHTIGFPILFGNLNGDFIKIGSFLMLEKI